MKELRNVTILKPVKQQQGMKFPIDPEKVRLPAESQYPLQIYRDFDYRQLVGLANNIRLEKGRLVADIRLEDEIARHNPSYELITAAGIGDTLHSLQALAVVRHPRPDA